MDHPLFEMDMSDITAYTGIVTIRRKDPVKETVGSVRTFGIVRAAPEVKYILKDFCS